MDECCAPAPQPTNHSDHCHPKKRLDFILWGSVLIVSIGYLSSLVHFHFWSHFEAFANAEYELMNQMWIGLAVGILFVGILSKIPREFILSIFGQPYTFRGLIQATIAGLLLDMCSHGILLVGMKVYKRGASLGQTMAFLISSPWNSLSITIILVSLIGLKLTAVFIFLSVVVALISGVIFDWLVIHDFLPQNPHFVDLSPDFSFFKDAKKSLAETSFNFHFFKSMLIEGFQDSQMIIKWIFFGVALTAIIRSAVPHEMFMTYLGPSLKGLLWTLLFATVIEICSEGATPMAADIIQRAGALGNGFVFLMAGVATNYTGIMSIKETTGSWKPALYLPLITIPQIVILGYFLNHFSH